MNDWNIKINVFLEQEPTCCAVNFLEMLSFPADILWVDKANIKSSALQPIKFAAVVRAAK